MHARDKIPVASRQHAAVCKKQDLTPKREEAAGSARGLGV